MKQSWPNYIEDFMTFCAFLILLQMLTTHTLLPGLVSTDSGVNVMTVSFQTTGETP